MPPLTRGKNKGWYPRTRKPLPQACCIQRSERSRQALSTDPHPTTDKELLQMKSRCGCWIVLVLEELDLKRSDECKIESEDTTKNRREGTRDELLLRRDALTLVISSHDGEHVVPPENVAKTATVVGDVDVTGFSHTTRGHDHLNDGPQCLQELLHPQLPLRDRTSLP